MNWAQTSPVRITPTAPSSALLIPLEDPSDVSDLWGFADTFMADNPYGTDPDVPATGSHLEDQLQPSSDLLPIQSSQGIEFAASATHQQQYAAATGQSPMTFLREQPGASATFQQQYAAATGQSPMPSLQQKQQHLFGSKGKESADGSKERMHSKDLSSTTQANVPATGSHLEEQLQPSSDFQGIEFASQASAAGVMSHFQEQPGASATLQQQYAAPSGQSSASLMTSIQQPLQQQQEHDFLFRSKGKKSVDGVTPTSVGSKKRMPSKPPSSTTQAYYKRQRVPKKAELVATCNDLARENADLKCELEVSRNEVAAHLKHYKELKASGSSWDSEEKKKIAKVLSQFKDKNFSLRRTVGMLQQQLIAHQSEVCSFKESVSTLTEKLVNTVNGVVADTLLYKEHIHQLLSEFGQP